MTIAHLRIVLGASARPVHEVRASGATIGRDTEDIQVDDSLISRQHVRIERVSSGWQLVDLGSKNGGFVDGRIFRTRERAVLRDGMLIRLGDSLFVFRLAAPPGELEQDAPAFPGVSPVATTVRRKIAALAEAPGHALVLGETGTGKERVARAIAESRAEHPFVIQNCGELDRELARSELFGYAQGAFSGATQSKPGLVDSAGDGVLFLDEIGELAVDVQVDLLRFLEDGSYRPVGGRKLVRSAARVIAATNVDLDQAVAGGRFRRDLLARLRASNAPLELPPLRERREDIPPWCLRFLREAGHAAVTDPWTVGALECLLLHPWLGNLRELRGVVRALFADGQPFPCPTERLPESIYTQRNALRGHAAGQPPGDAAPPQREPTQAEIEEALRQTSGKMVNAAKLLGIERTKLYRLCRSFGIVFEGHRLANQPEEES